jgi:hypothetical protein
MSESEKSITDDAKRRSPSFPVVPIDEAIERARRVYRQDRRAFTNFETLIGHLGYNTTKKGGRQGRMVSTLKQYGLIDERDGQYRVSETAWKILEMPEDSEERARLVREAALNPPMFRKILKHYEGELPSDATIRSHLLFQERFNSDSATTFIRVLRRTIELVNPTTADYNAGEESEEADEQPQGATSMQQPPPRGSQGQGVTPPPQPPAGQIAPAADGFQFQISERSVNVLFNGVVTQEAIKKLIKYLEISVDDFPSKKELEQMKSRAEVSRAFNEAEKELNEEAEGAQVKGAA